MAFINRAKGIGMSLEDIADLVATWPDTECRVRQGRLRGFLAERIRQLRAQRGELEAFEAQFQTVVGRLASRQPGPELCGKGCGCESDLDVTAEPSQPARAWGCSLDREARNGRIGAWRMLAATALSMEHDGETVRLTLPVEPDQIAASARLCTAESTCCTPAHFILEIGAGA